MAMQMGQEIIVDFDVPATMRDGTTLRANVYRPAGEGQWPVLLTRLPYGKDLPGGTAFLDPAQVARRGYVVVVQDTRGRSASEGEWVPFVNEAQDGYDTVEWAAQLPQSNGSVGMYGISNFGFMQWARYLQVHSGDSQSNRRGCGPFGQLGPRFRAPALMGRRAQGSNLRVRPSMVPS